MSKTLTDLSFKRALMTRAVWLCALASALSACGTDATETARACAESELIAQCPPGSSPELTAEAESACSGSADVNIIEESGSATGACQGSGSCRVLCKFSTPCQCGVQSITREGVTCNPCNTACGDGVCEAGEDATACPIDCGARCTAGQQRCNGTNRQVCNDNGVFETLACPADTLCAQASPTDPAVCTQNCDVSQLQLWYPDADTDGFGDKAGVAVQACSRPQGYAGANTDCDDQDPNRNPDATEVVGDEVDQDCDGTELCYLDTDGDSYWAPGAATVTSANTTCRDANEAPLANANDCAGADPNRHPGAQEVIGSGVDEDCDGADLCYLDEDSDGFSPGTLTIVNDGGACDGPQELAAPSAAPDCDDKDPLSNPDEAEVCNDGRNNDCAATPSSTCALKTCRDPFTGALAGCAMSNPAHGLPHGRVIGSARLRRLGAAFAPSGDVNGDGREDVLIGAPGGTSGVALFFGPLLGERTVESADALWISPEVGHEAGGALAVGDINADGALDLLVGASLRAADGVAAGGAYLVLGPLQPGEQSLSAAAVTFAGEAAGDRAGHALAIGNFNGDTFADILISAPMHDAGGQDAGAVYLFLGPFTQGATLRLSDAAAKLTGSEANERFGAALAVGRFNADTLDDALIGAPGRDLGLIWTGRANPASLSSDDAALTSTEPPDSRIDGADLGLVAASIGDLNNDNLTDFMLGAPLFLSNGQQSGQARVYMSAGIVGPTPVYNMVRGMTGGDEAVMVGSAMMGGNTDFTGNGREDIFVGLPGADADLDNNPQTTQDRTPDTGEVWVLSYTEGAQNVFPITARYSGVTEGERMHTVSSLDHNGDGFTDLLMGAPDASPNGAVYVIYGGGE